MKELCTVSSTIQEMLYIYITFLYITFIIIAIYLILKTLMRR